LIYDSVGIAHDATICISLPRSFGWLTLGSGCPVVRRTPDRAYPQVDTDELIAANPGLSAQMRAAAARTGAVDIAAAWLAEVFEPGRSPLRRDLLELWRWAPILEHVAYRFSARCVVWLDSIRRETLGKCDAGCADADASSRRYWDGALTLAHATLLASSREATPWLSDMAASFTWHSWTPSFPLFRERSLWMAAVAAKSAIAFGPSVVDRYLETLERARSPMRVLDSLFGLTALALDVRDLGDHIAAELRAREPRSDGGYDAQMIARAYASALSVIGNPEVGVREVTESGLLGADSARDDGGLFTDVMMNCDPGAFLPSGQVLGLAALPLLINVEPETFYAATPARRKAAAPREGEIGQLLRRAWASGQRVPVSELN
jgi:hypothetical protein